MVALRYRYCNVYPVNDRLVSCLYFYSVDFAFRRKALTNFSVIRAEYPDGRTIVRKIASLYHSTSQ